MFLVYKKVPSCFERALPLAHLLGTHQRKTPTIERQVPTASDSTTAAILNCRELCDNSAPKQLCLKLQRMLRTRINAAQTQDAFGAPFTVPCVVSHIHVHGARALAGATLNAEAVIAFDS